MLSLSSFSLWMCVISYLASSSTLPQQLCHQPILQIRKPSSLLEMRLWQKHIPQPQFLSLQFQFLDYGWMSGETGLCCCAQLLRKDNIGGDTFFVYEFLNLYASLLSEVLETVRCEKEEYIQHQESSELVPRRRGGQWAGCVGKQWGCTCSHQRVVIQPWWRMSVCKSSTEAIELMDEEERVILQVRQWHMSTIGSFCFGSFRPGSRGKVTPQNVFTRLGCYRNPYFWGILGASEYYIRCAHDILRPLCIDKIGSLVFRGTAAIQ